MSTVVDEWNEEANKKNVFAYNCIMKYKALISNLYFSLNRLYYIYHILLLHNLIIVFGYFQKCLFKYKCICWLILFKTVKISLVQKVSKRSNINNIS